MEIVTKRCLHQQEKHHGRFSAMFPHGNASLHLFLAVWIILTSLGVICYDRWVLNGVDKKLLQGLVSHELTAYLSIFNLFKLSELWPYYHNHVNQIILNRINLSLALQIFKAFIWILLTVNPSLNQTLLKFLLYVRQTWMTQLITAISLWEVIFLWSKRILILICMILQLMWEKDFLFQVTYL